MNIVIRPKGSDFVITTNEYLPTATVPIEYVLANIAAEDLVYKILRSSKESLSVSQITERIAKYLGFDKSILARATFFNPSDSRFVRLQDGSFTLSEIHEPIIDRFATRERAMTISLETSGEENLLLKNEMESMAGVHKKQIGQPEEKPDCPQESEQGIVEQHTENLKQRGKLSQLIQRNLKLMFERLHEESEPYTIK